jgi:hypothetical protein
VDYKTGSVNPDDLKIKSPDQLFVPEKKNKAFQVLYYAWLYSKMHGSQSGMSAGLFATRKPGEGFMKLSMEKSSRITPDILNDFENQLFQLIRDLFNPDLFFAPVVVDLDDDESNEYA